MKNKRSRWTDWNCWVIYPQLVPGKRPFISKSIDYQGFLSTCGVRLRAIRLPLWSTTSDQSLKHNVRPSGLTAERTAAGFYKVPKWKQVKTGCCVPLEGPQWKKSLPHQLLSKYLYSAKFKKCSICFMSSPFVMDWGWIINCNMVQ